MKFPYFYEGVLISPYPDQEGNKLQRTNSGFIQHTHHEAQYTSQPLVLNFANHSKKFRIFSVQPGLRGSSDLRVQRKMATFQLFFQSREQMVVQRGQIRRIGWVDNRHMKVVRLSALRTGRLYPPGNITDTHFCQRLSGPQGHSAVGRITSMKNSSDTIGNQTRDFSACSSVPPLEQGQGYGHFPSPMYIGLNNRPSVPPVPYPVIGALSL